MATINNFIPPITFSSGTRLNRNYLGYRNFSVGTDQFMCSALPMASATYCPDGKVSKAISLWVAEDGTLFQKARGALLIVGSLNVQGNYYLKDGQSGNMFQDLKLLIPSLDEPPCVKSPFLKALLRTQRNRALINSEILKLRPTLNLNGLTGQHMKVGLIDNIDSPSSEHAQHVQSVASIISHPILGVAPDAEIISLGKPAIRRTLLQDNIYSLTWNYLSSTCETFLQMANCLNDAVKLNNPSLRVLNLSQSLTQIQLSRVIYNTLNEKTDEGNYKYPQLRATVFQNAKSTHAQMTQASQFITQLFNMPQVRFARDTYIQATRNAAEKGICTVVSMGNQNIKNNLIEPLYQPGMEMNQYAKSPFVISVGCSNSNQTPGYYFDDTIDRLSSRGDGYLYNPTVLAPGAEIPCTQYFGESSPNLVLNGTSYSAPYVCGFIALMLQQNPNLSFMDVKFRLQSTATRLPSYTDTEQGFGVINPKKLLNL